MQNLVSLLSEEDEETLRACWGALGAVTGSIAKELLAGYSRCLRDALATAREKQRRKRKPGELLVPGLCLPKTLGPILPIYLQVIKCSIQVRLFSRRCHDSKLKPDICE